MPRASRVSLSHLIPHLSLMSRENILSECKRVLIFGVQQDQLSHQKTSILIEMLRQAEKEADPVRFQGIIANIAMNLEGFPAAKPPVEEARHDAGSIIALLPFEHYSLAIDHDAIIIRPSPGGKIPPIILEKIAQIRAKISIEIEVRVSIPEDPTGSDAKIMWVTSQEASFRTGTGY